MTPGRLPGAMFTLGVSVNMTPREQGLDLVEVNPKARPPVYKMLDCATLTREAAKKGALNRRARAPIVFVVRSKLAVRGRLGVYLVGDLVTGGPIRAGMAAHVPGGPDVSSAVAIRAVEYLDRVADNTSELGLHVVGDTPEQLAAMKKAGSGH